MLADQDNGSPVRIAFRAGNGTPRSLLRWLGASAGHRTELLRILFGASVVMIDLLTILVCALLAGFAYHAAIHDVVNVFERSLRMGAIVAMLFIIPKLVRKDYTLATFFSFRQQLQGVLVSWNYAFVSAGVLEFLTKSLSEHSRAAAVIFYALGLASLCGTRLLLVRYARHHAAGGRLNAKRIMLVGSEAALNAFSERFDARREGMQIIAANVLRGSATLSDDLALAGATARILRPDDIYILAEWTDRITIDACVSVFQRIPASLHLGPERILEGFQDAKIDRAGNIVSLNVVRRPMTLPEFLQKRALDISISLAGLVVLSPVFILVALMIKLD